MADVFISYKSEERPTVVRIAELLRLNELSVWWDDQLQGEVADKEITHQIKSSHAVVVLISRRALESDWVQGEIVRARDKVVPVRIDDLPHDHLPTPLLTRNTIDLSGWNGRPDHREFPNLVARCIQLKTGRKPTILASPTNDAASSPRQGADRTRPSIEIGQINGGNFGGGIGSSITNNTYPINDARGERQRDDKQ